MASSEELVPVLPDTLPENFSEWDGDASSAPAPAGPDEWESVYSQGEPSAPKAHGKPEFLDEILSSVADRSRVWRSDSHAPVVVKPQNEYTGWDKETSTATSPGNSVEPAAKDTGVETSKPAVRPKMVMSPALENPPEEWPALSAPVFAKPQKSPSEITEDAPGVALSKSEAIHSADEASSAPTPVNAALANEVHKPSDNVHPMAREADKVLFEVFSGKNLDDDEERGPGKRKKLMIVGGVAAAVLIPLSLVLSLGHHGTAAAKVSAQPVATASDTPETSAPDQSTTEPLTQDKPTAATKSQQSTENPADHTGIEANPSPTVTESQTQMMNDQLTAPKMISGDIKKQIAENAPPPANIGAANVDALAGSGPTVNAFMGGSKPIVRPLKPVAISSGVATGMLILKTPPIYPAIAKTARVSGTVELEATISKNGTIKDVRVASGPVMLRQAAVDAVRTWRYKPYQLNNQPTEVETTVNVVFNLGN